MPAPTPTPAPPPRPAPPAQTTDWTRAPLTLGDWKWSLENGQSVARFGGGVLVLRCNLSARTIELSRSGAVDGQTPLTVLTSALTRTLSASPATGPAATQVTLAASDPLLDAMAFSRGRFAIETPGLPRLVVPSWTEVSRVVEDCR